MTSLVKNLRERCVTSQNGPWVPEGFSRVWRTEILRFAETAQNKPMVPRVEKWAILQ